MIANDGGGAVSTNGGAGVDRAGLPDGAVLPRDHDEALAVPRVRRAAGRQHRVPVERERAGCGRRRRARRRWRRRWWRRRTRRRRRRRRCTAPAAPSPATSRPIRRTSTCSSPAATTAASWSTRIGGPARAARCIRTRACSRASRPARLVERVQWTFPIVFSPVDPNVLYTATQHVWKTTNGGQTGMRISGDLTRHDPKTLGHSGGPITGDMNGPEVYATVFALAPSKVDVNVLWAGSDDGMIHVTRNGGKTWDERHAEGHAGVRPRQHHRRVGVRRRHRLRRGEAAAARRPSAVPLPHARLRQDVDEDRQRPQAERLRARDPRGSQAPRACSTPARSTASTTRTTTATTWHSLSLNLPDVPISDIMGRGHATW